MLCDGVGIMQHVHHRHVTGQIGSGPGSGQLVPGCIYHQPTTLLQSADLCYIELYTDPASECMEDIATLSNLVRQLP